MVESGFYLFPLTFNKPKIDSKANRAIIDQLIPILKDSVDATAAVGCNKNTNIVRTLTNCRNYNCNEKQKNNYNFSSIDAVQVPHRNEYNVEQNIHNKNQSNARL